MNIKQELEALLASIDERKAQAQEAVSITGSLEQTGSLRTATAIRTRLALIINELEKESLTSEEAPEEYYELMLIHPKDGPTHYRPGEVFSFNKASEISDEFIQAIESARRFDIYNGSTLKVQPIKINR